MRWTGRILVGLGVILSVNTTLAWACLCVPTTAADAVASGDALVVGTVSSVGPDTAGCTRAGTITYTTRVRLDVERVITGDVAPGPVDVRTSASGGECGAGFEPGERWVVQIDDRGRTSACSASRKVGADDAWPDELAAAAAGDTDG